MKIEVEIDKSVERNIEELKKHFNVNVIGYKLSIPGDGEWHITRNGCNQEFDLRGQFPGSSFNIPKHPVLVLITEEKKETETKTMNGLEALKYAKEIPGVRVRRKIDSFGGEIIEFDKDGNSKDPNGYRIKKEIDVEELFDEWEIVEETREEEKPEIKVDELLGKKIILKRDKKKQYIVQTKIKDTYQYGWNSNALLSYIEENFYIEGRDF
jgi:hypothetical protein